MQLIITEKPSMAQSIAAALGVKGKKADITRAAISFHICTACGSCLLRGATQEMEL